MPINVKMPTVVGILSFMSRLNFVLSLVGLEQSLITSRHGLGSHSSPLHLQKKSMQQTTIADNISDAFLQAL